MFIAKVYVNRETREVKLYEDYEHFLSDLTDINSSMWDFLPASDKLKIDFTSPEIRATGTDKMGFSTDFEYGYPGSITVYCGKALTQEAMYRNLTQ